MYPWAYQPYQACMYKDLHKFLQDLLKAVSDEARAADFYSRVLQIAPTGKAREYFRHALEDEREHYQLFTQLYTSLTGQKPQVHPFQPVQFTSFEDAVEKAVNDELEAYEMYRDMYLSTFDPVARDIMLRGFTDEGEHAIRFTNLRN